MRKPSQVRNIYSIKGQVGAVVFALSHLVSKSGFLFIKPYFSSSNNIVCVDIEHITATQYVGRVVDRSCDLSGKN